VAEGHGHPLVYITSGIKFFFIYLFIFFIYVFIYLFSVFGGMYMFSREIYESIKGGYINPIYYLFIILFYFIIILSSKEIE
jgi:hypothetical protein